MTQDLDISAPGDEREVARFGEIASRSLGFPSERAGVFLARVGARNVRLAKRGAEVVGGLVVLPMGQWFGGRSVPCVGISAVAVAPEHRSSGIASELMRAALEEMRREGAALSSLWPATFPVYRSAGYETAGNRIVYRLPVASLGASVREADVRAATPADHETMHSLWDAHARSLAGQLDRSALIWSGVLDPLNKEVRAAYIVEGAGGAEGYVVLSQQGGSSQPLAPMEIVVRDVVVRTPEAGRRMLRLLHDHRSVASSAMLTSGPGDPLFLLMREELLEVADLHRWMLRIVDVRAALEKRGWLECASAEVHLEVRDALLRDNARRWVLEVANGRAHVREGGTGAVAIDARGLAALYSGFLSGAELRAAGLCTGSEADVAKASSVFAGPAPWMADWF